MGSIALAPTLPADLSGPCKLLAGPWSKVALFLIAGYLCMSRSFAYLGLPWFSIYIGEVCLAAFLFVGPRTKQGPWLQVAWRARRLQSLKRVLLVLLCYGALQALRGIFAGYPPFTAARDTAFNYYPLFLFLGIWVGLEDADFLRQAVRVLAWCNGLYGLAYVLFLSRLPWTMPGTASAASPVPLFSEPYGSAVALLGLLAFEPKVRRVWHLFALNALVMLWAQVRAEWVAFTVGLLLLAWCTKRLRQVLLAGSVVLVLLAVMSIASIDLPSPQGRSGRISVGHIVGRALAPINKSAASELASSSDARIFAGTASWRLLWWSAIWREVHGSVLRTALGLGYGYPIGELNPLIEPGTFIQTPHSDFFYALGFSGWLGVVLFGLLQAQIAGLLWRSYRITAQPFGPACWIALLAASFFEDFFEAPFGAIPFYLLVGMALAPALLVTRTASAIGRQIDAPATR